MASWRPGAAPELAGETRLAANPAVAMAGGRGGVGALLPLIHDDLPMDDDDFRRGRPSCHRAFDEPRRCSRAMPS